MSKTIFRYGEDKPEYLDHLERWMLRNEADLAPYRAEVPKPWRKAAIANHYFPRECFPRAIQFMRLSPHLPEALYVFGEAACGGVEQHGWVEIGDVVFDGVMQEFYAKSGYYQSESVRVWYRFTRQATLWIDRRLGEQYHWPALLLLPWADFNNPELIDLEKAKRYWQAQQARERQPRDE